MAFYIKVTQQVCKKLGHGKDRNNTADNNKLLWQADLNSIKGETIFDRAAAVGGVCLDSWAAKAEIDGTANPAEVYTPDAYKDEEPVPTNPEHPSETDTSADASTQTEGNAPENVEVVSDTGGTEQTNEGGQL